MAGIPLYQSRSNSTVDGEQKWDAVHIGRGGGLAEDAERLGGVSQTATTHQRRRSTATTEHHQIPPIPLHCTLYARALSSTSDMRSIALLASCLTALSSVCTAELNLTQSLSSKLILPANFKPPQVFKNVNLVRTTNLDKEYPREVINVIIENIDANPQSEYYLPFESSLISRVGGLEVKDKKAAGKLPFKVEVVEYDLERYAGLDEAHCSTKAHVDHHSVPPSSTSSTSQSRSNPKPSRPSASPSPPSPL